MDDSDFNDSVYGVAASEKTGLDNRNKEDDDDNDNNME